LDELCYPRIYYRTLSFVLPNKQLPINFDRNENNQARSRAIEISGVMKLAALQAQARQLKQHTLTVYFAARDPRTPFFVRALAVFIAAYALSPIDLIPDFIPLIGYLDDLVLIPLGLAWVVRLTPPAVMESARLQAQQAAGKPVSYSAAAFIIFIWFVLIWFFLSWLLDVVRI
jgi:uncharacterized membrane protein YkvA (DUF1232 family)